jgi:hypothetical protein
VGVVGGLVWIVAVPLVPWVVRTKCGLKRVGIDCCDWLMRLCCPAGCESPVTLYYLCPVCLANLYGGVDNAASLA